MKTPVKIIMTFEDSKQVRKIFEENETPNFTIIGQKEKGEDAVEVEIMCYSIGNLWFLAKRVQVLNMTS